MKKLPYVILAIAGIMLLVTAPAGAYLAWVFVMLLEITVVANLVKHD
jgi:hypothetical protein